MIVGVPLFAFTVGHLAGYAVDAVAFANHRRIASRTSRESEKEHTQGLGSATNTVIGKSPIHSFPVPTDASKSRTGANDVSGCCCGRMCDTSSDTYSFASADFVLTELLRRGKVFYAIIIVAIINQIAPFLYLLTLIMRRITLRYRKMKSTSFSTPLEHLKETETEMIPWTCRVAWDRRVVEIVWV